MVPLLTNACAVMCVRCAPGYELRGRNTTGLMIRIKGRDESWVPLAVNKFDSTRKRMSIVVKDKHGNIRLLCKGADSGMLGRGTCGGKQESETLIEHLKVTQLSASLHTHPLQTGGSQQPLGFCACVMCCSDLCAGGPAYAGAGLP